ncbi:MAG TPA: hypothetical protein PLB89_07465 [Flavobacteriales bacterium]|nr:hypothetical protein [Flavobacteriales bacterium]
MKTTIELPDDLLRAMKVRAAKEGRSLKELLTAILRSAMKSSSATTVGKSGGGQLPVLRTSKAKAGREMTPERIAEVLWGEGA